MANTADSKKPSKPKKKKGPIRTEAVGPFVIITVLVCLYVTFFFDGHLRSALEWVGTMANGAEVDIDDLNTSFRHASFKIGRIQVTDKSHPEQNLVELEEIRMGFSWDALLRGKFVTEDAAILGIAAKTQRSRPGRIVPETKNGFAAKIEEKVKEEFKKKYEEGGLDKIVALLKGFDPSKEVQKLVGSLASVQKIAGLQSELDAKEKDWQKMLTQVPGQQQFADLQKDIDSLQTTNIKSPADAKAKLDAAKGLVTRSQSAVNDVKSSAGKLQSDLGSFEKQMGQVDDWVGEDRKMLESKLQLPKLDAQSITGQLFRDAAVGQVSGVRKYVEMARGYMPEKKTKPVTPPAHARATGKTYRYPLTTSYPLFWLKRAEITSKVAAEHSGELKGELTDATTDPQLVGRPMVLRLAGNFPKIAIEGVSLQITADHREEPAKDGFELKVASFPSNAKDFVKSDSLVFGLLEGIGSIDVTGQLVGDSIKLTAQDSFKQPEFRIEGSSDALVKLTRDAAKTLKDLWFKLEVQGSFDHLQFGLDSNVGGALAGSLSGQLNAQVARARTLIDTRIREEVSGPQQAIKKEFSTQKDAVNAEVDSRLKSAQAMQAKAERKIAELQKQAGGAQLGKLKKKLPF